MYDLKQWFLMPSVKAGYKTLSGVPYGIETHHLEGVNMQGSKVYAYHSDTGKTMVFTKTRQGFPWDGKPYDQNFIYDWFTELDWSSPKDYKMMTSPVKMCPRYWDGDTTQFQLSASAAYGQFQNCKQTGSGDVGPAYYTLSGPSVIDFEGDLGELETIVLAYYWGKTNQNREQLFLTQAAGWVKWTHGILTAVTPHINDYALDSASVHNKVVAGQVKAQFPCIAIP